MLRPIALVEKLLHAPEMHDKGLIERITLLVSDSMIKRNPPD
jgi:hypothetical protein